MDWGKIMAYNGYYGAKILMTIAEILRRKKLIGNSPLLGIIALVFIAAFLGFASAREAKTEERRGNSKA